MAARAAEAKNTIVVASPRRTLRRSTKLTTGCKSARQEQRHEYQEHDDTKSPQERQADAHGHHDAGGDQGDAGHLQVVGALALRRVEPRVRPSARSSSQVNSMRARRRVMPQEPTRAESLVWCEPCRASRFSHLARRACKHGRDGRSEQNSTARLPRVSAPRAAPQPARVDPPPAPPRPDPVRPPRLCRVRAHPELLALQRRAPRLSQLSRVNLVWLLAGFGLEAAALVAYGRLTKSVLPEDGPPSLQGAPHRPVHPRGEPRDPGRHRRGHRARLPAAHLERGDGADAGFALATQGIGSAVVLNAMLWVALVISIPLHGFNSAYVTVAVVGAVLLAAFAALVLALTRGEAHATRALRSVARRVPGSQKSRWSSSCSASPTGCGPSARSAPAARTPSRGRPRTGSSTPPRSGPSSPPTGISPGPSTSSSPTAWPTSSPPCRSPRAASASSRPWRRPRSIGFGVPAAIAWLGVISWRLFNFWLPIPVGAGAYLSLRVQRGAGPQRAPRCPRRHDQGWAPSSPLTAETPSVRPGRPPRSRGPASPPARSAPPRG